MLNNALQAEVIPFPEVKKSNTQIRKKGVNRNKEGSVRNINGYVYIDFYYLDERIRESSGLKWNPQNVKLVREQLDRIIVAIKTCTFRFANVFPESSKRDHFSEKDRIRYSQKKVRDVHYL